MSKQAPHSLLMIKPQGFGYNASTSASNAFQNKPSSYEVEAQAINEFEKAIETLTKNNINLILHDNLIKSAPDAVFPNNWFSTHDNGSIVLYPMMAVNRRIERRMDIIDGLQNMFAVNGIVDLTEYESQGVFLEGTGSIIFDHNHGRAYAAQSERTNIQLLNTFCDELGYEHVSFLATDQNNQPIYHTNVMLSICSGFVVICSESIENLLERNMVLNSLKEYDQTIIDITNNQMKHFCANVLEVNDEDGNPILVMSSTARAAFTGDQLISIQQSHKIIDIHIPTIENIGGGSARCMMAGIHLPDK